MPAYSAQIVPKFANNNPMTAKYPQPWPQRSRMMPTNPLPLAAPIAHRQQMKQHQQHGRGRDDPQQSIAVIGAEYGIGGDAGRIVVREPGEQPRPEHGQEGGESPDAGGAEAGRT